MTHLELSDRATEIIEQSHLPLPDKKILEGRLPFVGENILQMFVELCDEDPFSVESVVRSMQKKLDAQGNLKKIHEIVKQERREIEESLALG